MQIEKTSFDGLLVITPNVYKDDRGYFMESYKQSEYEKATGTIFVQDNESLSQKGVIRGLHFQKPPFAQAKLIRVIAGSILDVVVDLRKDSKTFGKHFKHVLTADNKKQLFIPQGFAHGFLSLEDQTVILYKCSEYYHKESEDAILWNDETLNINWETDRPILTEKDKNAKIFSIFESPF
jgi:dTDP-4-dehydrorhamnose 3,5-epimerase